jgi:transmembrane sensor
MNIPDLPADQRSRLETAAKWWSDLARDPSLARSAQYLAWSADPGNLGALRALHEAWAAAGAIDGTLVGMELRRQAVLRAAQVRASRWRMLRVGSLAAAVLVGIALAGAAALHQIALPSTAYYQTAIGERRVVVLADGSRIHMDSDTRVHVAFERRARVVTLDGGRSRFDVTHDPARPFKVTAGSETVVAVGTSFNVELLPSSVLVTLIEGQVVISSDTPVAAARSAAPASPLALRAGEQLVASRNVAPAVRPADLQAAMAWESGHLVFRDEPLESVVARVNRYVPHPIEIDPALASRRISGVFNAGDLPSFVSAVTRYLHLHAAATGSGGILLQPSL